jgi:2-oxoglutarate/2-oxoacid ferredoxin oxidoreductase subunit alpha
VQTLDRVVIRFAGDSGDGMQLTGDRFTTSSALYGNDLATLPDFPAEIRAPAGTLAGVSAFQVHISDHEITTPGDAPTVLVAMNPAALRSQIDRIASGATVIVNVDAFDERSLTKAGYEQDPLADGSLDGFTVFEVPMTSLTKGAVEHLGVKPRDAERSKNFFALGLVSWMYTRPVDKTLEWIERRFASNEKVLAANTAAFKAGHAFGETAELFDHPFEVQPAQLPSGTYTNVSGNTALAWGLIAASQQSDLPLFLGSYPITPASDILHELSKHKNFGVRTFQAEDEIAGIGAALGAAFAGNLAATVTSGPGVALKAETIGLAVSVELPLIVINIQRGGPSTGLPTKTEQSDLLQAMFGRNGESPIPVVAASSPGDCFFAAIEAARIAVTYMTPVAILSDGYLANSAEPWCIPKMDDIPQIPVKFRTDPEGFLPYLRDDNLARPWAIPGTPGLEHRIGGLEKEHLTGAVCYDPANHELMSKLRADKIARIADSLPPTEIFGDPEGELLVVGWGCTTGAIQAAVARMRARGHNIGHVQLRHLNPFPKDLGDILKRYKRVLVPELNLGQLVKLLRAQYLVDARSYPKIQGKPFKETEIIAAIVAQLESH